MALRYFIANTQINANNLICVAGYKVERLAYFYFSVYLKSYALGEKDGDIFCVLLGIGILINTYITKRCWVKIACKNVALDACTTIWPYPAFLRKKIVLQRNGCR